MQNIWRIFIYDLRSLSRHFFAMVVIVAITILPSLYGWMNIYSNWDPYGSTGNISIAVASADEGCTTDDGTYINKGQDVIEDLKASTSIRWVIVADEETAVNGVYAGDYYAAVVIHRDFSQNMYHLLSAWDQRPALTYYENNKKNAVATKITDTAVSTLKQTINQNYLEVLLGALFENTGTWAQDLSQRDTVSKLVTMLESSRRTVEACGSTVDAFLAAGSGLSQTLGGLNGSLQNLSAGMDLAVDQLNQAAGAVEKQQSSVTALAVQLREKQEEARQALAQWKNDPGTVTADSLLAAAQQVEELNRLLTEWSQALGGGGAALGPVGTLAAALPGVTGTDAAHAERTAADALAALMSTATGMDVSADTAAAAAAALAEYSRQMSENLKALAQGSAAADDLTALAQKSQALLDAMGEMTDLFFTPDGGRLSQDLPAVLSQTASLLDQLQLAVSDGQQASSVLRQAIPQGETALRQAREGLYGVDDALGSFLSKLENQDITAQIDALLALGGKDPALYSAFFSQMVQTSVVKVYPIENYGSAMAPFYSVLAIWVGGVMLVAIVKVHAAEEGLRSPKPRELFFGRYLLFFLLAQVQSAIITAGDLYLLKIQCVHPGLLFLTASVTGFVFSLLIYALTVSFGDVGKAVVVVVMVLQIAGSSGTFPIELLPDIYQKIYLFFPFPYAINAMRECIGGLYGTYYMEMLGKLSLFAVAALLIGLLVRRPFMGVNRFVEEKLEETELL